MLCRHCLTAPYEQRQIRADPRAKAFEHNHDIRYDAVGYHFNASTNVAKRSPYLRHYAAVHFMIIVIGVWTRFHLRFYGSQKFMGSHGVYME
jgi:hypothetical protein